MVHTALRMQLPSIQTLNRWESAQCIYSSIGKCGTDHDEPASSDIWTEYTLKLQNSEYYTYFGSPVCEITLISGIGGVLAPPLLCIISVTSYLAIKRNQM